MTFGAWAVFAAVAALSSLSPGPAVLFVVSQGLAGGARGWRSAIAGIETANAAYFVLSAFGVGAMLATSHTAFTVIKYAGAIYLIALGVRTIRSRELPVLRAPGDGRRRGGTATFWRGVTLQASNPKAIIYFAALLPQFIDPHRAAAPQLVVLAITDAVVEVIVLGVYGSLAARATTLAARPGFARLTNRLSGGALVLAGAAVALRSD